MNFYDKQGKIRPLSDDDVLELKLQSLLLLIKEDPNSPLKKYRSLLAIKTCGQLNKPIPEHLLSDLNDACDLTISEHRSATSPDLNERMWEARIHDVEILRASGLPNNLALKKISDRDICSEDTITRERTRLRKGKTKELIEEDIVRAVAEDMEIYQCKDIHELVVITLANKHLKKNLKI